MLREEYRMQLRDADFNRCSITYQVPTTLFLYSLASKQLPLVKIAVLVCIAASGVCKAQTEVHFSPDGLSAFTASCVGAQVRIMVNTGDDVNGFSRLGSRGGLGDH